MVDWHNQLIGHMQHSARDPLRDHAHGRIYRITCPSRPLVQPAKVAGASVEELLANLNLPEDRTRYRTRRELRGRPADAVLEALGSWVEGIGGASEEEERWLLEALWVTWGLNRVDEALLRRLLAARSHRVRAAAVRVLRYHVDRVADGAALLEAAAGDTHGRVRLEAIIAASWLDDARGLRIVEAAGRHPVDKWMKHAWETAHANLSGLPPVAAGEAEAPPEVPGHLDEEAGRLWAEGAAIYARDGHCVTCHQADGKGLAAAGFPPLDATAWVQGDEERLIKLTLNGLMGPLEVKGKAYPGLVPMTPFRGLLDDREVAAVLTYVRNAFGNRAAPVSPDTVAAVRRAAADNPGFWSPEALLEKHPWEGDGQPE